MEKLIYLTIFLLLSIACVFFLHLDSLLREAMHSSMNRKAKMRDFHQRGKVSLTLNRMMEKRRSLMEASGIPKSVLLGFTAICAAAGFFAGRIIYRSLFISACVAVFGTFVPVLVLSFRQNKTINARLERLSSSMMILSNSYLMTDDFITSVEQNLELLEYPEPFRDFLTYVTRMDSNIRAGLRRMEEQVDNPYFSQWIDALILAQNDRSLKYVTVAVVDSFHDMIRAQQDSDAAMYTVWRDYLLTLVLIFSVPLVFKVMMNEAYIAMTSTIIGQGLFLLLLAAVAYSVVRAVRINRPIIS